MSVSTTGFDDLISREYQHGFVTDLAADALPSGLGEDVIRLISAKTSRRSCSNGGSRPIGTGSP